MLFGNVDSMQSDVQNKVAVLLCDFDPLYMFDHEKNDNNVSSNMVAVEMTEEEGEKCAMVVLSATGQMCR